MDFPDLNTQANKAADFDQGIGLIVQDIQKYDETLENIEEDWSDRQSLKWLAVVPELDVWNKRYSRCELFCP